MMDSLDSPAGSPRLSDGDFEKFRRMIHGIAGISMSAAKKPLVCGRLAKRMRQHGMRSYGDYFELLMRESQELQIAVDLLTTNETYFFREPSHFDFLREAVQALPRRQPAVRVWSAACSSGEEAYTIAMVLDDALGTRPWEVVASDISTRVLDRARAGHYLIKDAERIPRPLLARYCLQGIGAQDGTFIIDAPLRAHMRFMQLNLNASLPTLGEFDLIFLRNVMIYFDLETKRQVVERVLSALRPGGHFIISHAESLNGIPHGLDLVSPSIYRKPPG